MHIYICCMCICGGEKVTQNRERAKEGGREREGVSEPEIDACSI